MIELLFESWIRTAILAGGIGIVLIFLRVDDPALRHSAWKLVLLAMMAMPFVVRVAPSLELPILPPRPSSGAELAVGLNPVLTSTAPTGGAGLDVLYLGVGIILMVRIAVGYLFAIRLVRSGVPIDRSRLYPTLGHVRYLVTKGVTVPMTLGWLRPVVLFPSSFETWSAAKVRVVLDHEHAHIARRDFLTGVVASFSRAIHWLNPMAWWLEWRLASLAEHAADDVAAGMDRQSYATYLVELAEAGLGGRLQSVPMANMRGLSRRIERLSVQGSLTMSHIRTTTFVVAGVLLFLGASLLSVTHASPAVRQEAPGEPANEQEPLPEAETPFRIGAGVTAPTVVSQVQPEYTEEAREARYEGVVVLEGVVRTDGSIEIVRVVRGLGFGLDQKAIEALEQWTFRPGTRNGEPVDVAINVEVNFNLHDGPEQPVPQPEPPDLSEEPLRIGAGVTPPTVVSQVHPEMTLAAREEQIEGTVVLELIVHTDGTAEVVRVVRGLGYGLDFAAMDALEQWVFEPGTRNGEPVAVVINAEVNFKLR